MRKIYEAPRKPRKESQNIVCEESTRTSLYARTLSNTPANEARLRGLA